MIDQREGTKIEVRKGGKRGGGGIKKGKKKIKGGKKGRKERAEMPFLYDVNEELLFIVEQIHKKRKVWHVRRFTQDGVCGGSWFPQR